MRRYLRKHDKSLIIFAVITLGLIFVAAAASLPRVFATGEDDSSVVDASAPHHIIIYDGDTKLSIKSDATTVAEVIERAGITLGDYDSTDPAPETIINSDNFFINIHRARPALVIDGAFKHFLMTSSYDAHTIAEEAGLSIYDGDQVSIVPNSQFLELGVASVYEVTRGDGATLTAEEEIPFDEVSTPDPSLDVGKSEVTQLGEVGSKTIVYAIQTKNGHEVSREVISETVTREPVARITRVGTKTPIPPEREECASWARAAGVSEADLSAALEIIYHESGCRVSAQNASGAYGIPQALPGSKMASAGDDWQTNPVTQIKWMSGYVNRYGGWQGAYDFWMTHHWY